GRMETTWKIRPGVSWHDGAPFTADDLLFTARIGQDKEVGWEYDIAFDAVDTVEAPDSRTITIKWKRPFVDADTMFSHAVSGRTLPLPRHLLEQTYLDDRANLMQHPYWSEQFVGTGPFKLREWARGSHLIVEANEAYVLGRPKIGEIEVKFIPDPRTLAANILAGSVDLTIGRGMALEQGTQIRDQWKDGRMDVRLNNWKVIYPQFLDPNPTVVLNLQLRRALLHAIDRQQMADTFEGGLAPIGHSYLSPEDPAYKEIAPTIPRYDYDPRKAIQLIEELNYTRGSDGIFRDATNQRLSVEIRVGAGDDLSEKSALSVADYWRLAGVAADAFLVPPQQIRDREFAANFPGFYLRGNPNDPARLSRFHSSKVPLAENRFTGENNPRYRNQEFDALLERYSATIPRQARTQVLGQIVNHIADQVVMMGLTYSIDPTLIGNRVRNVTARIPRSTQAWNAHEWDVD
ncbi:MAG: hypothetical protein HW416_2934, partial [Chloroflexi bacterium]|nr:hypothetical protein [Chloroflexota bacterium]